MPGKKEVCFTSEGSAPPTYLSVLDLNTYTITPIKNASLSDGRTPNGGIYYNGLAYFATLGNKTIGQAPGIFAVSPKTFAVTSMIDFHYDVHTNSINDVTWADASVCDGEASMFFTSFDIGPYGEPKTSHPPCSLTRCSASLLAARAASGDIAR